MQKNHLSIILIVLFLSGWNLSIVSAKPNQTKVIKNIEIFPLPGSLDQIPVFNSNSPEIVQAEGILLSTLPPENIFHKDLFLDYQFNGRFNVFTHHIAKDKKPGERQLYCGLVAYNPTNHPVTIRQWQGRSYLSQPDAIFKRLPAIAENSDAKVFAGPGDRVATELLFDETLLNNPSFTIPPLSSRLIYNLPIPTNVKIPPPINGRTMLLRLESNGPVYLSNIATFAKKKTFFFWNHFKTPDLSDYLKLLQTKQPAGPREKKASETPEPRPKGGYFYYGRVAGISLGDRWLNFPIKPQEPFWKKLQIPGTTIGFPISSVYLKRYGTGQNHSAKMLKRIPGSAPQSHSNYGVTYQLGIPLFNPDGYSKQYHLSLTHPIGHDTKSHHVTYLTPPNRLVTFRGTLKIEWTIGGEVFRKFIHIMLRDGEEIPPFLAIELPGRTSTTVNISLIYPADATPPQLLTIKSLR